MKIETINADTVAAYLDSCTDCDVLYNRVYLEVSMTADHKHPDHATIYSEMARRAAYGEESEQIHDGAVRLPNSEGDLAWRLDRAMRDPLNDASFDRASFGYDSHVLDRLPTAEELVRGALRPAFWLESCNRNVLLGMANGYGAEALRAVDTDALHSATADIGTRLYLAGEMLRRSGKKRLAQKFSRLAGKIYDTAFALSTRADRILDLQAQMDGVNHLANLEIALNFNSSDLRPHAFLAWSQRLPDDHGEVFWSAVEHHWSGFDRIPHERFAAEFARFRDARPRSMLERIPERLDVYRGQQRGSDGLSWTTSREVAESFARGHRGMINDDPVVRSTTVLREEIAFLCGDRGEDEVVLMRHLSPADLV